MIGPILGLASGLLGGGGAASAPAGPVTQTVTTGAISLGNRTFGRGSSSTASAATATGGASILPASVNGGISPTVLALGAAAVVILGVVLFRRS